MEEETWATRPDMGIKISPKILRSVKLNTKYCMIRCIRRHKTSVKKKINGQKKCNT